MKTKLLKKARKYYSIVYNNIYKKYQLCINGELGAYFLEEKEALESCQDLILDWSRKIYYRPFERIYPPK